MLAEAICLTPPFPFSLFAVIFGVTSNSEDADEWVFENTSLPGSILPEDYLNLFKQIPRYSTAGEQSTPNRKQPSCLVLRRRVPGLLQRLRRASRAATFPR